MATPQINTKITFDSDEGRINNNPTITVLSNGQQVVFYSKYLTTGKESSSRITFINPSFVVNVEAGTGTINGIPVTWAEPSPPITATANKLEVVYVTSEGVVGIGSQLSMAFLQDKILLAFVGSGSSSITRIHELEHTGYYLYVRKQSWSGTAWVWEDYETLLNTGDQPRAYYDTSSDLIYLSYRKDSATYERIINPNNELTWEYLANIQISSNVITLNHDPENSLDLTVTSAHKVNAPLVDNSFAITTADFLFVDGVTYIYLPIVSSSFHKYITSDITYEILTKTGGVYNVEATFVSSRYKLTMFSDRWVVWAGTTGNKYVRIRLNTSLYSDEYVTDVTKYPTTFVYDAYARVQSAVGYSTLDYDVDARDNRLDIAIGSGGYKANVITTAEFEETRTFQQDTGVVSFSAGSAYKTNVITTAEYEEIRTFQQDIGVVSFSAGSGYKILISFVDH